MDSNIIDITIVDRNGQEQTYQAPTDMGLNLMDFCRAVELPVKENAAGWLFALPVRSMF